MFDCKHTSKKGVAKNLLYVVKLKKLNRNPSSIIMYNSVERVTSVTNSKL